MMDVAVTTTVSRQTGETLPESEIPAAEPAS
jgi:hypothetical protein